MRIEKQIIGAMVLGAVAVAPCIASASTVQQAVRAALTTNPDLQASISERYARDAQLRQARAGYYPSVNISGAYGRENTDNPYTRNTLGRKGYLELTRKEASISLTQNLFAGFSTTNETERDRALINAAAFNVQENTQAVALRTVDAYLDVKRWREITALAQQFLDAHQRIYQQIRSRARSGVGTQADVEQARGRVALAQSNLVAAKTNLRDAITRYQSIVGRSPDQALDMPKLASAGLPASLDQALKQAVEEHPALKATRAQVTAATAEQRARRGSYYPQLDFIAAQDWGENLYGREGIDKGYIAMLNLRYNLYNGGADHAAARAQAYRANRARDLRDQTYRQVVEEVQSSWQAYHTADARLAHLREHRDATAKTRDAYATQFKLGQRTLLDMLDSENELFEASRAYINDKYQRTAEGYRLLASTGQLLPALGAPMPGAARCVGINDCIGNAYSTPAQALVFIQAIDQENKAAQHRLGSFIFVPKVAVTQMRDDNIYATADSHKDDAITLASGSLTLKSDWARHMLSMSVGGQTTRYWTYNSENTSDYWGSINGRADINPKFNIFGSASRSYLHEDRTSPDYVYTVVPSEPIIYQQTRGHLGAEGRMGSASLRVVGAYTRLDYENVSTTSGGLLNNDVRDRNLYGYGARLTLNSNGVYQPFLQATYDQRRYDKSVDNNGYDRNSAGYRGVVGLRLRANSLHGEAFAGSLHQSYDDARFSDVNDVDYGMNLRWKPISKASLTAAVQRSLEETTLSGASGFLYTKVSGGADYTLAPKWTMSVSVSHGRSEYQEISRVDKTDVAGFGISYAIDTNVSLGGEVQHIRRQSDEPVDNYEINRVMAKLSAQI